MKGFVGSAFRKIIVFCIFAFIFSSAVSAKEAFDITKYHVDIEINEMNVYRVKENITTQFTAARHGIFRYIPYKLSMDWTNSAGETSRHDYHTFIKNVKVSGHKYSTSKDSGNVVIKIGDPDVYVDNIQQYNISYTHELWDDGIEEQDMVYYNIIPTGFDCDISGVTFSVKLPKSFDSKKIEFYHGAYKTANNKDNAVTYTVNAETNTITGTLNTTLKSYEGLTLYIPLPQDYFVYPPPFPWDILLTAVSLLILAGAFMLYMGLGRSQTLVTPVEFLPPDGITSAEAGYIIDNASDDRDVISLILYWASKGYLSIKRLSKSNFLLTKLLDLPENAKKFEKHMFSQLFAGREEVSTDDLKFKFYTTVENTKSFLIDHYSPKGENALFTLSSVFRGKIIFALSFIPILAVMFAAQYNTMYEWIFAAVVSVIVTAVLFAPLTIIGSLLSRWHYFKPAARTAAFVFLSIIYIFLAALYAAYLYSAMGFTAAGIASAAAAAVSAVLSFRAKKYTDLGASVLGRLIGFRNFIERAEKQRIELLAEENPSYFYDVLPFAYVLGITDKWARHFKGIALAPPAWYTDTYSTGRVFSALYFQSAIMSSMSAMRQSMSVRPSPKGGGTGGGSFGGGGGGFSGGGFGGGGGGSW